MMIGCNQVISKHIEVASNNDYIILSGIIMNIIIGENVCSVL